MGVMSRVPWWFKLGAKLALARLPLPYGFWRLIGLFRHGEMNVPERAVKTFEAYYRRAVQHNPLAPGFQSLELGPGDSVLSGLVARGFGADKVWLVDAGAFAETNLSACRKTLALLETRGKIVPEIRQAGNLSEVLRLAGINYLTQGTLSLAEIPDTSVDFFWSQVVFEHVPKAEFPMFLRELRRIAKPDAVGVHSIDFRDHMGGALNNLRFSSSIWESTAFRNSGFYTNRIRPREMLALFSEAGFDIEIVGETRWPVMPIQRELLADEFKSLPDEDFMVAEFEVVIRPER